MRAVDLLPDTYYAKTPDGAYIAYQVIGDGPIDVVSQSDWPGNIDVEQEDPLAKVWFRELASFSRLILHDRRGVGLSSRNVALPNLETRAPNALLAATRPELVHSIVWTEPNPRFAWAPDWPWGRTSRDMERELEDLELWGTLGYGRALVAEEAGEGNELSDGLEAGSFAAWMAKASRNACTPDVARALAQIWYETDIRALLPSIQVPTLIQVKADSPERSARTRHVASLIPGAEPQELPGGSWTEEDMRMSAEGIRGFVGAERPPLELDTVLSTVLFTDIVDSTQMQAGLGDHGWKDLIEKHHAIVRGSLVRWHGVENDTAGDGFYATFDGPARAIRCAQEVGERVRDLGIQIRAGVHTGECELIDGKVGGLAVTIGSRVAEI